ncbi:MAG TPA: CHASE3 domain-containing protein, partial [Gammaproteobacteria bacterium]|nr:CHASE3 domain-containing protein [Gammaproteobacteria bacterium]
LAYYSAQGFIETSHKVSNTHEILTRMENVFASMQTAVASLRGYVITGDPEFIEERDRALSALESSVQDIKLLTADDAAQQARLRDLEQRLATRRRILDGILVARQAEGFDAARELMQSAAARDASQALRTSLNEIQMTERDSLREYTGEDQRRTTVMLGTFAVLLVLMAALLGAILVRIRHDLARREAMQQDLARSNAFLDSIVEHIPMMVFMKRAHDLKFVLFNRAGESLTGFSRDELLHKSDSDFFPPDEAASFVARDREALAGRKVVEIAEEPLHTRDGSKRILHTRKLAIRNDSGEPQFLLGISEDITERKATEKRILELNENLKRQTAELEAANKELESFSYSVSHDLRAPLRAVDGFAQMLEEDFGDRLGGEGRRYIGVIRDGSRRMGNLIDDLLALSRLGRQPLDKQEIDMAALARRTMDDIVAGEQGITVSVDIGPLPPARGDSVLLAQVWSNLCGNAVKYSRHAPAPTVIISGSNAGAETVYCVTDNGVGFDMKYASKLFGVFQRLHSAEEFPGTGVGLAIVRRVITRHGGRVWAESAPGAGATFYFALPMEQAS